MKIKTGCGITPVLSNWLYTDGCKFVLAVADVNTEPYARSLLAGLSCKTGLFVYPCAQLVPDEKAVGQLLLAADGAYDALLAVGSGTINDLVRYVSCRLGIPFYTAATAASMDGYTSKAAPVTVNGLKITYNAHAPKGVIGDTDIIEAAPPRMTAAGFGDMMGKFTSVLDWELESHIGDAGDFNPALAAEMLQIASTCRTDTQAGDILNALLSSGLVMERAGHTKPASGSEHHLSHFWEMMGLLRSQQSAQAAAPVHPPLHGEKVGAAVLISLRLYRILSQLNIDWHEAYRTAAEFDTMVWRQNIRRIYGPAADGVIDLWRDESPASRKAALKQIQNNWPLILSVLRKAENPGLIEKDLKRMGCPAAPREIGISRGDIKNGLLYAHWLRKRFTIWRLADLLGLLPGYAEEIANES
jgi:glycerol-1-phosphate dehydrogenase [NAD(P)+]